MIRALFLPDTFFAQHILSIEISRHQVLICQATKQKNTTKIERLVSANIDLNNERTHEEQVLAGLIQALSQIKKPSSYELRISLPNNLVFFKEITVPFLDRQKIKMVLGYEIESSLPFSLNDAVLDFIITKQDLIKKESTLVVAIVQKKQLDFYLDLIKQAKLKIDNITVDLIGMFSLYRLLYQQDPAQYQILLDLGKTSITLSYLWQGHLWLVRNLPYGLSSIISKIASTSKKSNKDICENLFRFGFEQHDDYDPSTYFDKLLNDLAFTINSFQSQITPEQAAPKMLIFESTTEIKDVAQTLQERLKINCDALALNNLHTNKNLILTPGISINHNNLTCISNALITSENHEFNLLPANLLDHKLLRNQIITIIALTLSLFVMICGLGYFKNKNLASTLDRYQKTALTALKNKFTIDSKNLTDVISQASTNVARERKLWFSFSNQTRYSTLKYLQVLSSAIDMKKIDLDIKKLIINENTMTIKGSVEKFEDLYPFEQALLSIPIFKSVTKPQEKSFTINIILKQSDRDLA